MNFEDIKVVRKNVPFDTVTKYIAFVVKNSYDEDGNYHEYMKDFAEAAAVLSMYTDYDGGEYSLEGIMEFIMTPKWEEIKNEIIAEYYAFHDYVEKEIEYLNTPLRFADKTIRELNVLLGKFREILEVVDIEALREYDFSKITNAIDMLDKASKEGK